MSIHYAPIIVPLDKRLFQAVNELLRPIFTGKAIEIQIQLEGGNRHIFTQAPLHLNAIQKSILEQLDRRAMRTEPLGDLLGGKSLLYRQNNLKMLEEHGLIAYRSDAGYYRPDAPPPEWTEEGTRL